MHRTLTYALATILAAIPACATTHGAGGRPHEITVEVHNNLPVPTPVDVYVIGPAGTEQRLGFIPGGDSAQFSFRPDSYGQRYRLLAKRQLGRPIPSNPFTVGDAKTRYVDWTLINGMVTLYNADETTDTVMVDTPQQADTTKKSTP
jgi:hypothetical protein